MAKHAPSREEVQNSRWLRPFGSRIRQSDLWRFTRRSVPRGVAIGLFVAGFIFFEGIIGISGEPLPLPEWLLPAVVIAIGLLVLVRGFTARDHRADA